MKLTSTAFNDGSTIPKKYGYNYQNVNPPLKIENIPDETKSLVLIMDDPDALTAVGKIWVHWTLWNLSPDTSNIQGNVIPDNCIQGINDFGENGYGGPAPPDKEHTYYFRLYAINKILDLSPESSKKDIENQLQQTILEECILTGKYSPQ
jgi:Raf kinase inhibitor-like YbhB/YbcL family protein